MLVGQGERQLCVVVGLVRLCPHLAKAGSVHVGVRQAVQAAGSRRDLHGGADALEGRIGVAHAPQGEPRPVVGGHDGILPVQGHQAVLETPASVRRLRACSACSSAALWRPWWKSEHAIISWASSSRGPAPQADAARTASPASCSESR